jgi:hypothetical protein
MLQRIHILARRLDLQLAPASATDFPAIAELSRVSFSELISPPGPGLDCTRYDPTWCVSDRRAIRRVTVAFAPSGALVAYAFYMIWSAGDVYLTELAASAGAARVPGAASAVLGAMLAEAHALGCTGRATLNVPRLCRHPAAISSVDLARCDPVGFYEQFGFEIAEGALGYTSTGEARDWDDTWMEAEIAGALNRALRRLLDRLTRDFRPGRTARTHGRAN